MKVRVGVEVGTVLVGVKVRVAVGTVLVGVKVRVKVAVGTVLVGVKVRVGVDVGTVLVGVNVRVKVRVGVFVDAMGATSCAGRTLSPEGSTRALSPIAVAIQSESHLMWQLTYRWMLLLMFWSGWATEVSVGVSSDVAIGAPVELGENVDLGVSVAVVVAIPVWVGINVWVGKGVRLTVCVAVGVLINLAAGALLAGSDRFSITCRRLPAPSYWYW